MLASISFTGLPINCERLINKLTKDLPQDGNIQIWVGAWR